MPSAPTANFVGAAGVAADDHADHGLAHAHRLVRSILRQITEGDAPPGNFEGSDAATHSSLTGSNHGGRGPSSSSSRGSISCALPGSAKKSSASRPNYGFPSDGASQADYFDGASTTASEFSVPSSCNGGALPYASPKPSSRFPPRPPSSHKRDVSDAGSHSAGDKASLGGAHSAASSYGIGAGLMGTLALAELCSRTVESGSRREGERRGRNHIMNNQFMPGALPPPPLSPLESEESSPRDKEQNLLSVDQNKDRLGMFSEEIGSGLGKLAVEPSHGISSQLHSTPRLQNAGQDASSLGSKTPCDDQGFPCDNEIVPKSNDDGQNDIARVETSETDTSWNTETGTFSFEDAAAGEGGNRIVIGELTTPVNRPAPSDTPGRPSVGHRSGTPLSVQRSLSNDDAAGGGDGRRRRIMMFGSEYARILSSSKPLSSCSDGGDPRLLSSASKARRSASAASNRIRARFSSSVSAAQSIASTAKESVESGASGLLTLSECPPSIATAAVTDVVVTDASDVPPRGYYRAFQLGEGEESIKNMVPGRKRQRLYLNVKKEPNWDRAVQRPCVTAFCVIYPDRNEFVPPGFSVVRQYHPCGNGEGGGKKKEDPGSSAASSPAANINLSASGERVYMCYRRSREGNPITGIVCLRPSKGDPVPEGYTVLERTPRNYLADLAAKSEQPAFLAYRQRLENLECLRPLPLVLSVSPRPDGGRKELKAYYCTGGTAVQSDVGRYHIMDRSTHSLLSSSSAQSRLNVIQSSRKDSETAVPAWVSSASSISSSSQIDAGRNLWSAASSVESPSYRDDSSESSGMRPSTTASSDTCFSRSPSQNSFASSTTSTTFKQSPTLTKSTSPGCNSLFSHSDDTLQTSIDTMYFIPPIECARTVFQNKDASHSESLLHTRVAVITPILTSCYMSQGGAALMAVEGLISLLNDTNFFAQDVVGEDGNADGIIESSARLTLLDLVIQVVCDVATSSARETHFRSCVDFVSDAVRYAGGKLNDRTIGFVLRFYLFVFYFGASIPTSGWPFNKECHESKAGILDDFLLPDDLEQHITGGAPQASAIALKEFVSIMLSRVGTGMKKAQYYSAEIDFADETLSSSESLAHRILSSLVENAMNRVEVANYTQLATYQIHRSGGSELFWHDMINSIGEGLFGQGASSNQGIVHSNIISFAILTSFIKISSGKIRMAFNNTEPVPRDVASKLLSFELLLHFIKIWHVAVTAEMTHGPSAKKHSDCVATRDYDEIESVATMIYVVRRLVIPTLLSNTSAAIEDCRVYRRVLRVITQLWCNPYYRGQMKIDLAVLIEHFILKVLCLGPQVDPTKHPASAEGDTQASSEGMPSLFNQQLDVLEELKIWFSSNPKDALDLYINYDNQGDMLPTRYCKLMNKICEALSTLSEQCGAIISEHGRFASINGGNGSPRRSATPAVFSRENETFKAHAREAAQSMREKSFRAITAIVKSVMECAVMSRKQQEERLVVARSDSYSEDKSSIFDKDISLGLSPIMSPVPSFGDENIVDYWKTSIEKRKAPLQPIRLTSSQEVETPVSFNIKQSMSTMSEDSSKQAQLQQQKQESLDVAFELIATKGLKKGMDYLIACHLLTPSPRHISSFLRIHQSSIDPGMLGEYLGEGGIDGTDKDFWNLIRFNFARATSFVGMNIEQALRHFLTNCGFRLPGEAQKIDRIVSTFSQCYWEDNAGDIHKCPFQDQDTVFLVSFAIIMLNTDLHKSHASGGKIPKRMTKNEFITNLRGVYNGVDKFRDYIYTIYDSIESAPIVISNSLQSKKMRHVQGPSSLPFKGQTDLATSIQGWVKSVKPAQELLRTVAVRHDSFTTVDDQLDDETSLQDLTCQMFSANWHHIHGAINATIDNAHLDLAGLDCCIDVLEFSLVAASYLGMTVERSAFSKLLGRVNRFNDLTVKKEGLRRERSSEEGSKKADSGRSLNFEDVDQVRSLTKKLHTSLHVDNAKIHTMKQVARRIRNGDILLNDPSRTFVREGDLVKRHQLVGRSSTYRFFLFSDVLVYAHKSPAQGDYKVHEELPLHLMKIADGGSSLSNTKQNSFHIIHPNKSFYVVASSNAEKQQWIEDINNSIRQEVKRKAKLEKSRIEAARRAAI